MGLSRKEPRGSSHLTEWMCVSEGGEPWDLLTTLNRNTASLAFKRAERVQNERLSDLQNSTNKKQADKAPLLHIHANLNKKETFVKQTQRKEPWVQKGSHNHRKLLPDFETKWEFGWILKLFGSSDSFRFFVFFFSSCFNKMSLIVILSLSPPSYFEKLFLEVHRLRGIVFWVDYTGSHPYLI